MDPNPLVAGGGFARLRAAGVEITEGCLTAEAARLNTSFLTWIRLGRPHVTAKAALTLDNKVAGAGGARLAITSPAANRLIHQDRAAVDAIAVGSGTILADDPLLTARGAWRRRPLVRVIFDRALRTPPAARLFSTSAAGPVIIMSSAAAIAADAHRLQRLERAGAEVEAVSGDQLGGALQRLGQRGITSLLVEGGPRLHAAFSRAGLVDAWQLYLSSMTAGDGGMSWLAADECSIPFPARAVRACGPDVRVDIDVHRID
jgi:diaminohydroxyphosphoribosylaminopyrimidine deaminase/5-amino-6-(5-phosphoribosylamino)uracil reductase